MRCPCCEKPITVTHQERYQSTEEHVSNPNGYASLKDGYQCLNEFCPANNLRATWIEDGEIYMDPPDGIKNTVAHRIIEKTSVSGMYYALDSWSHSYNKMVKLQKEKTIKIVIGKFRYNLIPKYKTDYDKTPTEYKMYRFRRKIEIWKSDNDKTWTHFTPFHISVKWKLDFFERAYAKMIDPKRKSKDDSAVECMEFITGKRFNKEDAASKFAGFLIRVFKWRKVKKVRQTLDELQTNQYNK